jgi:proteasome lid subunit RPN8/RPN11
MMKHGSVRINRHQLAYFRKRARDSKKECLAYFLGEVVSPELVIVKRLYYPKTFSLQTTCGVTASEEESAAAYALAESSNMRVVGTIHSHPDWVPILSPTDYKEHIKMGDRLSAVVGVNGSKTRVYFWVAESALPLKIEYV